MSTQDSRIKIKRSTVAGVVPTVPASNDHTDGTWIATDIYKGELYYNQADNILFTRADSGIKALCGNTPCDTRCASLTIASADVLQLNTTPLTIVAAQGSGTAIELISASMKMTFNSSSYSINTNLAVKSENGSSNQAGFASNVLGSLFDVFNTTSSANAVPNTNIVENDNLQVTVDSGDPTAGDSDITVYVTYRVITL